MGPPRGHMPCQQTCSTLGSSLHRATARARSLLQHGLPMGSQPPSGIHLLQPGPPWAAGEQPASPWSSSQAAREDSLLRLLKHLLPPPSSLTLVSAELFLSHCLTPLSSLPFHCSFCLPLLEYVIPEALPPSLIGLALASGESVLELAVTGFIRHGGNL